MGLVATTTADSVAVMDGADDAANDALYSQAAIEQARDYIEAVPGSGPVRGVALYKGDVYAFRDNAGATAGVMHKATSEGWVEVDLGWMIEFDTGTTEILEGEVITGATSGATATVLRVCVYYGDWTGTPDDAAGHLIIDEPVGGPFQAEGITSPGGGAANVTGAESAITLPAGGRYEFVVHNFFANADARRLYGVNGVGRAFEFDGSMFTPIGTGNVTDTPYHIEEFAEHLFLAFPNGSLQHSGTGSPCLWTAGYGASELGIGHDITGIKKQPGGVLGIFGRNHTALLYGSLASGDDAWQKKVLRDRAGAIEWTIQEIGDIRYLDDRGLTMLAAVQEFGDFSSSVWSQDVERILEAKRGLAIASLALKEKNQYILFFSDKSALVATFIDRKLIGITPWYFEHYVECTVNGEDALGDEITFFGSDDGMVYQLNSGTSLDGLALNALISIAYTHLGSPMRSKKYRKLTLEVQADFEANISYQASYEYGNPSIPIALIDFGQANPSGGSWDISNWDQFVWASESVTLLEGRLDGEARNIGLNVFSTSTYVEPYTIYSAMIDYAVRRLLR